MSTTTTTKCDFCHQETCAQLGVKWTAPTFERGYTGTYSWAGPGDVPFSWMKRDACVNCARKIDAFLRAFLRGKLT